MFKAIIIETEEEWTQRLTNALFSMNFECIIAPDEKTAVSILEQSVSAVGLVIVDSRNKSSQGMDIFKLQQNLGYNRPIIGILNDSDDESPWSSNLTLSMEEMAFRKVIDDSFDMPSLKNQDSTENKRKILMIEDEPETAQLLSKRLLRAGYEPFVALNGGAGKQDLSTTKPHLVILDVNMPEIDGLTLTKMMKAEPETAKTPIIGVSADDREKECLAAGCDYFFQKPYKFKDLQKHIESLLNS